MRVDTSFLNKTCFYNKSKGSIGRQLTSPGQVPVLSPGPNKGKWNLASGLVTKILETTQKETKSIKIRPE